MNYSDRPVGYLTVTVSTARGAIPLEGATVNIRNDSIENSELLYSLISDRDGRTPKVSLDTPPLSNSDTPGGDTAFSTYNIDVFKNGYTPLFFHNVPIFPGVHSIQPAVMIPSDHPYKPYGEESHTEQYPQSSIE